MLQFGLACSDGTAAFVDMIGTVDLENPPLDSYVYHDTDGGVEGGAGEDDDDVEEVDGVG